MHIHEPGHVRSPALLEGVDTSLGPVVEARSGLVAAPTIQSEQPLTKRIGRTHNPRLADRRLTLPR
jgi:hypothetical protein